MNQITIVGGGLAGLVAAIASAEAGALPSMPVGTHVGVVDPGVGTDRLALAIRIDRGDLLVGPDNGLIVAAAEALGGIVQVRSIENRDLTLPVITPSFHGRDVFAPAAAHLAAGVAFSG